MEKGVEVVGSEVGLYWELNTSIWQRETLYRSRRRRECGESQTREETVESTLCRHPLYRSVVLPPYPTQRAAVLQSVKGERGGEERGGEGGTALSLRVQVEKAGGETHYCSSLQCHSTLHGRNYRTSHKTHIRESAREREKEREEGVTEIKERQLISHDCTFFPFIFKLHAFASSF